MDKKGDENPSWGEIIVFKMLKGEVEVLNVCTRHENNDTVDKIGTSLLKLNTNKDR